MNKKIQPPNSFIQLDPASGLISAKDSLKEQYLQITQLEGDAFYNGIARYVKYILESQLNSDFLRHINLLRRIDLKEYDELTRRANLELSVFEINLNKILETFEVIPDSVASSFTEYNQLVQGILHAGPFLVSNRYNYIIRVLRLICEQGYREKVKKFIKGDRFSFSPSSEKLLLLVERLKNDSDNTIWRSWDKLFLVYLNKFDLETLESELVSSDNLLLRLDIENTYGTFHQLFTSTALVGPNISPKENGKYPQFLQIVHNYLTDQITKLIPSNFLLPSQEQYRRKLIEKDASGNFLINGIIIFLGANTDYQKIFELIYDSAGQDGTISFATLIEGLRQKIQLTEPARSVTKKTVQNALSAGQGLFRYAKVGKEILKNEAPNGQKIIEVNRGKGYKFYNPNI